MAIDCDPCKCPESWYRNIDSYRKATIVLFCNLGTAIADMSAAVVLAIQTMSIAVVDAIHAMSGAILTAISDAVTTITTTVYHVIIDEGHNHIGEVCIDCSLPAGDNNIGNVDIITMPDVVLASDTTIGSDRQVCTLAGTPDQFASHACKRVDIMALPTNTDIICIGDATVDAVLANRNGIALAAGQTYSISIANTNILYIDAVVSGEGVCYNFFA